MYLFGFRVLVRVKHTRLVIELSSSEEDVVAVLVRPPVPAMPPPVPVIDLSSSEEVPVAPVQPRVAVLGPSVVPMRPRVVPVRRARAQRRPGPAPVREEPTLRRVYPPTACPAIRLSHWFDSLLLLAHALIQYCFQRLMIHSIWILMLLVS